MDVIDFLQEENTRILKLFNGVLPHLSRPTVEELKHAEYREWDIDDVFDSVREILDAIMTHLDKQNHLYLAQIQRRPEYNKELKTLLASRSGVEDEMGRLVQVHVDEPEYLECLRAVLKRVIDLDTASRDFDRRVRATLSKTEMDAIDEVFKAHLFQSGTTAPAMTTHSGIHDVSVKDR